MWTDCRARIDEQQPSRCCSLCLCVCSTATFPTAATTPATPSAKAHLCPFLDYQLLPEGCHLGLRLGLQEGTSMQKGDSETTAGIEVTAAWWTTRHPK